MGFWLTLSITPWPSLVFLTASAIALPVYLLVVVAVLNGRRHNPRFKATYYHLLLSQALTDFLAMPAYALGFIFRSMMLFTQFYWRNASLMAPFAFNSNHLFLMLRCFGDFLVAIQRYLILCQSNSALQRIVVKLPFLAVLLIHWIPPILVSLPITLDGNKSFDAPHTVRVVIGANHTKMADLIEVIYQLVIFFVSAVAYFNVLKLIVQNRISRGLTREMRLSLVVMGQSVAFGMSLTYYITQFIVVHLDLTDAVFQIRNYYPLLTGFESYINPFLHLFLNSDVQNEVLRLLRGASFTARSESQSERAQNSSNRIVGTSGTAGTAR